MDKTPVIKIRPDIEVMDPEQYEPPELKIAVQEEPQSKYCPHEYIKVYPHHRIITCSSCGQTLDPFEYLLAIGKSEQVQLSWLKHYKKEAIRYRNSIEELKKELAKTKRQVKDQEGKLQRKVDGADE